MNRESRRVVSRGWKFYARRGGGVTWAPLSKKEQERRRFKAARSQLPDTPVARRTRRLMLLFIGMLLIVGVLIGSLIWSVVH